MTILEAVEELRKDLDWNQAQMAKRLELARSHYSEFVSKKRGLPFRSLKKAYELGVPADILLKSDMY